MTETSPAAIDAKIAELNSELARTGNGIDTQRQRLRDLSGDDRRKPTMSFEEARLVVEGKYPQSHDRIMAALAELESRAEAIRGQLAPLTARYERERWSRFYLVPGGHIHSSMYCSTCNKVTSKRGTYTQSMTNFVWLTELSGSTEAEAVEAQGALLCTVCYPSAPIHWTNALELAAAAKAAEKCPGSGTYLDRSQPHRAGYYSGNWGTCPECSGHITLTSSDKLRAHKPSKES